MNWLQEFPDHHPRIWLNTAHQGVLPLKAAEAARDAVAWKLEPWRMTQERFNGVPQRVREGIARLIGADANDVVLANGASHGQHLWADGLGLNSADEVLLMSGDFPSTRLPWLRLRADGVVVRDVESAAPVPTVEEVEGALTDKTRVLGLSWVHSFSGLVADLGAIGELCRDRGVTFLVNTTQGTGALELSVEDLPIDGVTNAGWKWLCGPYATGFCWMRPEFRECLKTKRAYWLAFQTASDLAAGGDPDPDRNVGARRFDLFAPANFFSFNAWAAGLELLGEIGVDRIRAHDAGLVQQLLKGVDRALFAPVSEVGASSIVVLEALRSDAQSIASGMAVAGIEVAVRHGRVRLSPHLYNTAAQIERAIDALNDCGRQGANS